MSNRSFYEEFAGKEDLLGALHDDLNAAALVAVVEALDGLADDVEARAHAGLTAYFATMTADARLAKVVLVEAVGVSPSMEARRQAAVDRFADVLTAELTRLGLPASGDPDVLAVAVVGATKELVTAWALGPLRAHDPATLAAAAATYLLAAARA